MHCRAGQASGAGRWPAAPLAPCSAGAESARSPRLSPAERSPERARDLRGTAAPRGRSALGTKGRPWPAAERGRGPRAVAERAPAALRPARPAPRADTWFAHGASAPRSLAAACRGRGRASRSANARRRGPPCDVTRCRAGRGGGSARGGLGPGAPGTGESGGVTRTPRRELDLRSASGAFPSFSSSFCYSLF